MNPQRKRIIISEIKYWKQSKLLPEHYCDFLIALYGQGDGENVSAAKADDAILVKEKKRMNWTILLLSCLALIVCSMMFVLVQYPGVTMTLTVLFTFMLLQLTFRKKQNRSLTSFLYILAAFLLLVTSFKLWFLFFEGQFNLLIALLILNCALWLMAGRLLKLLYFTISGAAGLLLITAFLIISY
ncbi:hypothetical protein MHZ95_14120 [Sporosarcina sp. ACRSM]|uniref:hypothetical protein n=1 Tax=Sporosarcina sp. ACRSM TaxID=2918216 RepID=UPI001EF6DF9F|nr:hypothetical protein [Sporosarcina sp. ACRSM]MCG7336401.1 hypothetical protein [Sporosarcina sp. ACRSM]